MIFGVVRGGRKHSKVIEVVVVLVAVLVMNGKSEFEKQVFFDDFSSYTESLAPAYEGAVKVVSSVEPEGEAGAGAEVVEGFSEEASGFGEGLAAGLADSGDVCGGLGGCHSGTLKCFPDGHSGDVVFVGEIVHGNKVEAVGFNNFGNIGGRKFHESSFSGFHILYMTKTRMSTFIF
jgi:hypothetical protein